MYYSQFLMSYSASKTFFSQFCFRKNYKNCHTKLFSVFCVGLQQFIISHTLFHKTINNFYGQVVKDKLAKNVGHAHT